MRILGDAKVAPQREARKITVAVGLSPFTSRELRVEPLKDGRRQASTNDR